MRDALLNRPNSDLDFTTRARPDEIELIVRPWAADLYLAGKTYGTVGAIRGGRVHEITTFRSEIYRDETRKPVVSFSDDIETDLSRRDFAVNAMALRLHPEATLYAVDKSPRAIATALANAQQALAS